MPASAVAPRASAPIEPAPHVPGTPWTRPQMLWVLERSDAAVERGLLALYARQTADEQQTGVTREHNGMGFGAFDAEFLTSCAQQILTNRWGRPEGQRLTQRQFAIVRKKVRRYVGQLVLVANDRLNGVQQTPDDGGRQPNHTCPDCGGTDDDRRGCPTCCAEERCRGCDNCREVGE